MAFEESLKTRVGSLGLWPKSSIPQATKGLDFAPGSYGNAIAIHSDKLFALSAPSVVTVANMPSSDEKAPMVSKVIQFTTPVHFPIQSIQINSNGTLMALIGRESIIVAEIDEISLNSAEPVLCRSTMVSSGMTFTSKAYILKVIWHTLSSHHLVILTSDNVLRLLNVENFAQGAEQIYVLDHMLEEGVDEEEIHLKFVNFCLGDATCASWQAFTIFLLNLDSDIFVLCPIVPYNCRISSHYFSTLHRFVYSQLGDISKQQADLQAKEARFGVRRRSPTSSTSGRDLQNHKLYLDSQIRWISAVCGIQHKTALDSSLELYTRNPNEASTSTASSPHQSNKIWYFDISLQGPLETELAPSDTRQHAAISSSFVPVHDIFAISAVPLVLGRTHASGHVELLVAINHLISPSWAVPNARFQPNTPSWLLWAGVDLSTQSGQPENSTKGEEKNDKSIPALLPTPPTFLSGLNFNNSSILYLYSSCGIVRVDIPWIHQLDSILNERRSRDTPATQLQLLWNCVTIDQPLANIVGVAPYIRPFAPSTQLSDAILILAQFESGPSLNVCFAPKTKSTSRAHPIRALSQPETRDSTNTLFGSPASANITSSGTVLENYMGPALPALRAPAQLGPSTFLGNSSTEALSNSHNLQFYQHLSRKFDECEEQLKSMEEAVKGRLDFILRKVESDSTAYYQSCDRLKQASSTEVNQVAHLQLRKAEYNTFEQRLNSIKKIIRMAVDRALPVDAAWISELTNLHRHLEDQKRALDATEQNLDRLSDNLKSVSIERGAGLEPSQITLFTSTLNSQDQTISKLVATLKKLQTQLSDLEISV